MLFSCKGFYRDTDSGVEVVNEPPSLSLCLCLFPRLCLKRQVIDLLAEGYSPEQLDAQPAVHVEDW